MKKLLVVLLLVASMLLTLVACDTEEPVVNDPELNEDAVINALNSDKTFGDILSSSSVQLPEGEMPDIMSALRELEFEGDIEIEADGEKMDITVALKDGVAYLDAAGNGGYIFIEDDLKMVRVSAVNGEYVGEVDDSFSEFLPLLGGTSGPVVDDSITDDVTADVMSVFADLKLPEITKDDITVSDDKYILGKEYIEKVVELVVDAYCDYSMGAEAIGTQGEAMKAAICEYAMAMNIQLYFYVEYEEIVGVGIAANPEADVAEELLGCESLAFSFDMKMGNMTFKVEAGVEGQTYKLDATINAVPDEAEENVASVSISVDATLPASDVVYTEDYDSIDLEGVMNLKANLVLDCTKMESAGEVVAFDMSYSTGNFKAYEFDYETFESVYSEELTKLYGNVGENVDLNVKLENLGEGKIKIVANASTKTIEGGETVAGDLAITAEFSDSADNFPAVPAEVERVRQEALDEYENSDFDFDFDFEEDYFDEEYDYSEDAIFGDN